MKDTGIKRLYYSISEVSRIADEEQYVLRYWETEFEQLRPQKNRAGNRIYTDKDISVIRSIKRLLREKRYTIEGAKEVMRHYRPELGEVPEEFLTDTDILRTTMESGNKQHDTSLNSPPLSPTSHTAPPSAQSVAATNATNGLYKEQAPPLLDDVFSKETLSEKIGTRSTPSPVPSALDDIPTPPTSPSLPITDDVPVPLAQNIAKPPLRSAEQQATHLLHSLDTSPTALQALTREELEELRSVLQHILQLLS
jgi:DNA-binding transcriptional MerR regulator